MASIKRCFRSRRIDSSERIQINRYYIANNRFLEANGCCQMIRLKFLIVQNHKLEAISNLFQWYHKFNLNQEIKIIITTSFVDKGRRSSSFSTSASTTNSVN